MIRYKIVAVGKIKENYLKEAISEYAKRISRFAAMEIVEVEETFSTVNRRKRKRKKYCRKRANEFLPRLKGVL